MAIERESLPVSPAEGDRIGKAADAALEAVRQTGIDADSILIIVGVNQEVIAGMTTTELDPQPFLHAACSLIRDDELERWRRAGKRGESS